MRTIAQGYYWSSSTGVDINLHQWLYWLSGRMDMGETRNISLATERERIPRRIL
jgi:hypothetical protein